MEKKDLIQTITNEICKALKEKNICLQNFAQNLGCQVFQSDKDKDLIDISSLEYKRAIRFKEPKNPQALESLCKQTTARIGIGRSGPRLNTKTMLALRADHANAKDAVLKSVNEAVLEKMDLFKVTSKCKDTDQHLTRPDLGRQLSDEAVEKIKNECIINPQVQIYVSDGLSNSAIDENLVDLLPVLIDGLKYNKVSVGTPFFVKYGRVPTMDVVSEIVGAEVTCVLLGERPGLAASDSMSAYIAYRATVGMRESKRTVISNIHKNGIQPVEAGAYIVDLIMKMLYAKKSGVELKL